MKAHINVMLRGLIRVIFGSVTAGGFGLAGVAFWTIPAVDGYLAVGDFLIGVMALGAALTGTYLMGLRSRRRGI